MNTATTKPLLALVPALAASATTGQCLLGTVHFAEPTGDITMIGDTAYVPLRTHGVNIYDLSDPSAPVLTNTLTLPAGGETQLVHPDWPYVYVADHNYGIHVFDVTEPGEAPLVSSLELEGGAFLIEGSNGLLYTNQYLDKSIINIVDISNPLSLDRRSTFDLLDQPSNIYSGENQFYATDPVARKIYDIDVSDPTNPSTTQTPRLDVYPHNMFTEHDIAFVASTIVRRAHFQLGLYIFDISNLENPVLLGAFQTPGHALDVVVQNSRAYVTYTSDGLDGLMIFDVSDPSSPRLIDTRKTPTLIHSIFVNEGVAYVGGYANKIYIFDVSEACKPCRADVNQDGALTSADFTAWLDAFNTALAGCDQNLDAYCDATDFTAWINNYQQGCP